jgi:hypothetical protein
MASKTRSNLEIALPPSPPTEPPDKGGDGHNEWWNSPPWPDQPRPMTIGLVTRGGLVWVPVAAAVDAFMGFIIRLASNVMFGIVVGLALFCFTMIEALIVVISAYKKRNSLIAKRNPPE